MNDFHFLVADYRTSYVRYFKMGGCKRRILDHITQVKELLVYLGSTLVCSRFCSGGQER